MIEPVAVTPKEAFDALGLGNTKGYELIASGQLDAIKIGRATRITVESIHRFVKMAPRGTTPEWVAVNRMM